MKKQTVILRDEILRARVIGTIRALDLSRPWEVTVGPHRKRRSLSQNSLMWLWLTDVIDAVHEHTGTDKDDLHAFFKQKFLTPRIVEIGGEVIERHTTTTLKTNEMSEYLDKIYAWVTSELGIILPLPTEYMRDVA